MAVARQSFQRAGKQGRKVDKMRNKGLISAYLLLASSSG